MVESTAYTSPQEANVNLEEDLRNRLTTTINSALDQLIYTPNTRDLAILGLYNRSSKPQERISPTVITRPTTSASLLAAFNLGINSLPPFDQQLIREHLGVKHPDPKAHKSDTTHFGPERRKQLTSQAEGKLKRAKGEDFRSKIQQAIQST